MSAATLGGPESSKYFTHFSNHSILLAPNQVRTKQSQRWSHTTSSLDDLTGRFRVDVASRTYLDHRFWGILDKWFNWCSLDLWIRKRICSTFKALRISLMPSWSWSVSPCFYLQISHFFRWRLKLHSFGHYSRLMIIGEVRNKKQFSNWQIFSHCNLLFCNHRAINLLQICLQLINPSIHLLVWSSVSKSTTLGTWTSPPAAVYCHLRAAYTALGFGETKCLIFSADYHHSCFVTRSESPNKCMTTTLFRTGKKDQIVRR